MWAERSLLFIAILFFCVHSLPHAWRTLNTDFPNYYLAARLAHGGVDTSRMYEWSWIQRQKDYGALDIRVIGLLPITPFSTLIFLPLTFFGVLTAKHIWILLNLVLLIPIAWILHSLTRLHPGRIALAIFLSFPLYRNLLYGQFYIFLLFLILAACLSYLRGYRSLAGALVAIAGICKIFPLLLFLFFLRRRDWGALASGVITACLATGLSLAIFGLNAHRVWLFEILPWVMHGEGLGTYTTTASISGILHCLFLSEPQWNPDPWYSWPLVYAVLASVLPMLILAPSVLLIRRGDESPKGVLLEWSSLLTASLAISTIPASYNFVLMIFPVCVIASILLQDRSYKWLTVLLAIYLGIGFPLPVPEHPQGLALLWYVPRLPLMLAIVLGLYVLQRRGLPVAEERPTRTRYVWGAAIIAFVILNIRSSFLLEQGERKEYNYRIPLNVQGFANTSPRMLGNELHFIRFSLSGYQLVTKSTQRFDAYAIPWDSVPEDILSFTATDGNVLIERVSTASSKTPIPNSSQILDALDKFRVVVENAHDPMLSRDGRDLAFLRDNRGRASLVMRRSFRTRSMEEILTPPRWNVYEASFLSEDKFAVAAIKNDDRPQIFITDSTHRLSTLSMTDSRYPSFSPDGRWMAYSHLDHGFWNLWLRDEHSGAISRIANVPCNQIQPSWESDSKTLLYSSDCGRSIWFTAISRRKVIP